MKKEVKEGKLIAEGVDDVLTLALGKPEHGGRVRGQGVHVKQSVYFDLPRQKKARTMDEKIQERVQRYLAEETPKIIKERDDFWAAEMEKLRAEILKRLVQQDCTPTHPSQQASCHSNGGVDVDAGVNHPDTPTTAKNLFPVEKEGGGQKIKKIESLFVDLGVDPEDAQRLDGKDESCRIVFEEDRCEEVKVNAPDNSVCKLALGSLSNIVACAKIDEVVVVEGEETIHGVRLGEENARVSITQVIQGDAKIPYPIGDEILTVEQAMGTFIAWPRNLITMRNNSTSNVLSAPKVKIFRIALYS